MTLLIVILLSIVIPSMLIACAYIADKAWTASNKPSKTQRGHSLCIEYLYICTDLDIITSKTTHLIPISIIY